MGNLVKIVVYCNGGSSTDTVGSLHGAQADIVEHDNDPEAIENEIRSGDHRFVMVTDDRNTFDGDSWTKMLSRAAIYGAVASPVFRAKGSTEVFWPSSLDVCDSKVPFSLSWRQPQEGGDVLIPCPMGCCHAFSKEWFVKTGGLMGIVEPDNRDVFMGLSTTALGGRCMVVPSAVVTRTFGGQSSERTMGKEALKMAIMTLPQMELNRFFYSYLQGGTIEQMATPEELTKWFETRMGRGIK